MWLSSLWDIARTVNEAGCWLASGFVCSRTLSMPGAGLSMRQGVGWLRVLSAGNESTPGCRAFEAWRGLSMRQGVGWLRDLSAREESTPGCQAIETWRGLSMMQGVGWLRDLSARDESTLGC